MIAWAFEALIASALLMGLVLLVRERVAAAFGPRIAYLLWLLPLARMLLPRLPQVAHRPVTLNMSMDLDLPIDPPMPALPALPTLPSVPALPAAPIVPGRFDWILSHAPTLVLIVWLGGAVIHFGWQIGLYRRFVSAALRGSALLCRTCGIAVHRGPHVGGPAAVGILRRRILLPADFTTRYDPAERRLVLAHEVAHHVRGDLIANAVALAILSLHWFNPFARRAYRAFRTDQELACDATVLAHEAPELMPVYGAALVKSVHAATPAAACAIGSAQMLKRRLKMMAKPHRSRLRQIGGGLIAGATIVGGLCLTASGSVAAPSHLPGIQLAVMRMDGAPMSFDHDNGSSMRAATLVASALAKAPTPVVARAPKPAKPAQKPVRWADARQAEAAASGVRSDYTDPVPPAPPVPPEFGDSGEAARAAGTAARIAGAQQREAAAAARIAGAQQREVATAARIAAARQREAGAVARTAAAQARIASHAAAEAERTASRAAAEQARAEARAEAAQARAERSAVDARAAIDSAHIRETVAAALSQARAQMAVACRYARPAAGPETDRQAIARLGTGCVDQAAIRAQILTAFQKVRDGFRATPMDDEARERALDAMDRAIARMEARGTE